MQSDPAEIVRRLTEREREAVLYMPSSDSDAARRLRFLLFMHGLQEDRKLTPLGLLVRAELERMEARDE